MPRHRGIGRVALAAALIGACNPCDLGARAGARNGEQDGQVCAQFGTTRSNGPRGGTGEWQNCYAQSYAPNYYYYSALAGCPQDAVLTTEGDCPNQTALDSAVPIDFDLLYDGPTDYDAAAEPIEVITDIETWETYQSSLEPPQDLPDVDFSMWTVIAARVQTPSSCEFILSQILVAEVEGRALLRIQAVDNSRLCEDQCADPGAFAVSAAVPNDREAVGCAVRVDACELDLDP